MFGYLRLEVMRTFRNPRYFVISMAMPLALYLVFAGAGAGGSSGNLATAVRAMVGMAGYGALFAAFSSGPGLVNERTSGWLRQLRVTPLPASRVVIVKVLSSMFVALPSIALICAAASATHGVHFGAGRWVALVGLLWLGTLPFALLGVGLGFLCGPQSIGPATMATVLGMSLLGGLIAPVTAFPSALQHLAHVLPSNRFAELGWQVGGGHAPTMTAVAILLAWTAAFAVLAVTAYRRDDSRG